MIGGQPGDDGVSRRRFLRGAAALASAGPLAGLLAACGTASTTYPHAADLRFPRPDDPVTWSIYPENPPVAAGLEPEGSGPLELLTWDSVIAPSVLRAFERETGIPARVTSFYDMNQAISKLRTGAVQADVFMPTLDVLGRLIVAGLVQPLQHAYLPNMRNVWPLLQSPFYDEGSRYSVPYATYSTGIGWRTDHAVDPATLDDPWDIFWDPAYRDRVYILDDYRSGLQVPLLQRGEDINSEDARVIAAAEESLAEMAAATSVKWSLDDYTFLPEGRAWVHQAWSGDMITAPFYGPGNTEETAATLGYWFPSDDRGEVSNDVLVIPSGARNPVLAHRFMDFVLGEEIALQNFSWVGYQQPVTGVTREAAVEVFPWIDQPSMDPVFVTEEQLRDGYRQLELSATADALWQQAWLRFRSHG